MTAPFLMQPSRELYGLLQLVVAGSPDISASIYLSSGSERAESHPEQPSRYRPKRAEQKITYASPNRSCEVKILKSGDGNKR